MTGAHSKMEYDARVFFRRTFLSHCQSVQERGFWLNQILKSWPMVHQARILFLLYGPTINGKWSEVMDFFCPSQESFTYIEAVGSWMLEENEMLEENPCLWLATLQTF